MNIIRSKKKFIRNTNEINVHLSNEDPDMKMNFNTLQYFQVFAQNDMNNKQNAELLSQQKWLVWIVLRIIRR